MKKELRKDPTLFDSSAKVLGHRLKLWWNNGSKNTIVEKSLSKKQLMMRQKPACSRYQSYEKKINVVYIATD